MSCPTSLKTTKWPSRVVGIAVAKAGRIRLRGSTRRPEARLTSDGGKMTGPAQPSATAIAEAIERRIGAGGDENAVLGAVVYPLILEHGADAVLAELEAGKADPLVASALAYAADEAAVMPLTRWFTHDEIVTAALEHLLAVGTGDGPLAHSAAVPEHLARVQELAKTDPKIARAWWLNETDCGRLAK